MNVADIMTATPEVIQAHDPIRVALGKLRENDIRHLPVMRGKELVGMLSERDVRGVAALAVEESYKVLLEKPVSQFMSTSVVTANEGDDVGELIDLLIEDKIGAVPVLDGHDGRLVGIVSYIDVLRELRSLAG